MQLPFTEEQFLDLFAAYNAAAWPVVILLWAATCALVIATIRRRTRILMIGALLAVHWLWSGIVYHGIFFTRINPAAWLFSLLFDVQAVGLAWYAINNPRAEFRLTLTPRGTLAGLFLIYSLAYPALVALSGQSFPRAPAFAVPCPTVLLTAGFLFAAVPRPPRWLLTVPIAWSFIGGTAALSLGIRPDLMLWVAGASLTFYALLPRARASHPLTARSIRASELERTCALPGDELIGDAIGTLTHAITIHRRPSDVWPWIAQMGAGSRAGWYSYDVLDNGGRKSSDVIVPELQSLDSCTLFPALPGEKNGFVVVQFEKERHLVLGWRPAPRAPFVVTWAFVLNELNGITRLIVRARGARGYSFRGLPDSLSVPIVCLVHFVMERKQLLGIAERAESVSATLDDQPHKEAA